ncbi:hypothetical protein QQ045_006734 [Rhodiola kirilowii]
MGGGGSMTTNQSESFNHVLMPCRDLPITALVHFTFKHVNSYFIERCDRMMGHNKYFVPMIETLNNTNLVKAAHNEVQMYDRSKDIASVLTKSKSRAHEVSVEGKTCGCGKWQLFHYPYVHALSICSQEGLSIRDCVAYGFTTQAYVDTWAQTFNPQPDMTHWNAYAGPKHIPNTQFKRVKRGRNPTKRRHNEMDQRRDPRHADLSSTSEQLPTKPKRIFKCSICGVASHTKRSCTSVPIVRSLVRNCKAISGLFFKTTDMDTKRGLHDMFHATHADLLKIGEGRALNVDVASIHIDSDSEEVHLPQATDEVGPSQVTQANSQRSPTRRSTCIRRTTEHYTPL